MREEQSVAGFSAVKELALSSIPVRPIFFRRLIASLRTLDRFDAPEANLDMLIELKHVRKLILPRRVICTREFNQFLWQNIHHMEYMDIRRISDRTAGNVSKFWIGVRAMIRLKHLSLNFDYRKVKEFSNQLQNFPNLESLKLFSAFEHLF